MEPKIPSPALSPAVDPHILNAARDLLRGETPLLCDCGALCGARCCAGENSDGMALLPGEDAGYRDARWCRIVSRGGARVLICRGTCPREARPFACRIFPLEIHVTQSGARLRLDPLARALCPLAHAGLRALSPGFVEAAGEAARLLMTDGAARVFLSEQSRLREAAFADPLFAPRKKRPGGP